MLFVDIMITGGVLYAGVTAFNRHRAKQDNVWLVEYIPSSKSESPGELTESFSQLEKRNKHHLTISYLSVGLSASGALLASPILGVASVPLNLYNTAPVLGESLQRLYDDGQIKIGIFASLITIGSMGADHYFLASFVDWAYHNVVLVTDRVRYLNQQLWLEIESNYRQALYQFLQTKPPFVWVILNDVEVKVPFEQLKVGDVMIMDAGGVVPIEGQIIRGGALIDQYALTGDVNPIEVITGDNVSSTMVVLSGRIYIRVNRL